MKNIIVEQSEEIEQSKELEQLEDVKVIINQIVDNVINSYESNKLKRCVQIIANNLMKLDENNPYGYEFDLGISSILSTLCLIYSIS